MPKHYLWAVGFGLKAYRPGELIAERYQVQSFSRILLDTKPEQKTEVSEEISDGLEAYLKLFPYRLHVPQVYAEISLSPNKHSQKIWLLENGPLCPDGTSLLPELAREWQEAEAMRQLNWLWQIAQLWEPLRVQGVASSLLNSELLRVEGPIVKILELQQDRKMPGLQQLGKLWQKWLPTARSEIKNFLEQLCKQMTQGEVERSEQLINQLEKALTAASRSHDRTIHIVTGTEAGPSRSHNEDACYPPKDAAISTTPGNEAVAIVCDGIGGQEGGEVASQLAIDILRSRIQQTPGNSNPKTLQEKLEHSTCAANDAISDRNDRENRQGRQRMGTTLVMANAYEGEVFITHVGDSRAYLITRWGCHQVTLDDDVATREVRLGYAIYREAVQQTASGALVQALGITSSNQIHPTIQRFFIDEDCILLLCSDGLSDKDRVEQHWKAEILPVLYGERDLVRAKNRLIEIANTQNGHDNVTLALLYYQVDPKHESGPPTVISLATTEVKDARSQKHSLSTSPARTKTFYILGIILLLGWLGLIFYIFKPLLGEILAPANQTETNNTKVSPSPSPRTPEDKSPEDNSPENNLPSYLKKGALIAIASNTREVSESINSLILLEADRSTPKGSVPSGSIMQVMEIASEGDWLELKICSISSSNESSQPKTVKNYQALFSPQNSSQIAQTEERSPDSAPLLTSLQPGETGWIETASLSVPMKVYNRAGLTSEQQGQCLGESVTNE